MTWRTQRIDLHEQGGYNISAVTVPGRLSEAQFRSETGPKGANSKLENIVSWAAK